MKVKLNSEKCDVLSQKSKIKCSTMKMFTERQGSQKTVVKMFADRK